MGAAIEMLALTGDRCLIFAAKAFEKEGAMEESRGESGRVEERQRAMKDQRPFRLNHI